LEKFRSWWFDWKYGTDTAAEESLIESGVSSRQARQGNNVYRAFWGSDFIESVERSVADPGQHTFVDIGSGKGKLLLLVARFGFRKVIGIEYARELWRISQVNLMRFCLKTG
jgi:SAM-dependent methyltransferase